MGCVFDLVSQLFFFHLVFLGFFALAGPVTLIPLPEPETFIYPSQTSSSLDPVITQDL